MKNIISNARFDDNYNKILILISKIQDKYPFLDIYVFSSQNVTFDNPNIKIVNNLDMYAVLLNHNLCEAIISELSGGGEFSQYCHNKKIILYSGHYNIINRPSKKVTSLQNNILLHTDWCLHGVTNATLQWISSFDELLYSLDNGLLEVVCH